MAKLDIETTHRFRDSVKPTPEDPPPEDPSPKDPPSEDPMTEPTESTIDRLNGGFQVANATAKRLKKELANTIKTCPHQYEYTSARIEERQQVDGWGGSRTKWIKIEKQSCQVCGLREERKCYDPAFGWGDWEPINAPFGATWCI